MTAFARLKIQVYDAHVLIAEVSCDKDDPHDLPGAELGIGNLPDARLMLGDLRRLGVTRATVEIWHHATGRSTRLLYELIPHEVHA